jgi:hypothetical protein
MDLRHKVSAFGPLIGIVPLSSANMKLGREPNSWMIDVVGKWTGVLLNPIELRNRPDKTTSGVRRMIRIVLPHLRVLTVRCTNRHAATIYRIWGMRSPSIDSCMPSRVRASRRCSTDSRSCSTSGR